MKHLWFIPLLFLGGCSSTQPHILEYKISPEVSKYEFKSSSCKTKSLKVGRAFTSSELKSQNMRYEKGEYQQFSFTESKWATTPNSAITSALVRSINNQDIFASVSSSQSRSRSDLVLETRVEDFKQYFVEDTNNSFVKVELSISLVDARKNRVIETKHLTRKKEVQTLDAQGGVQALNKAFGELLEENNKWLSGACK